MGLRVLVVDDDEMVLRSLRRILERAGHEVIARTTVCEARAVMMEQQLDVVLCDYHLDDGTGADVASDLARVSSAVQMVLLTGDRVSVNGLVVLEKPVRANELLAALHGPALTSRGT